MNNSEKFRVNSPQVVHEMIDGEVVIVNLKKGDYYSLVKAGADIWNSIILGLSKSEIVDAVCKRYEGDRATIEFAIDTFIEQLQQEEMISLDKTLGSVAASSAEGNTATPEVKEKQVFEAPSLQKYTDMEELLALDPIHDVDEEQGWPRAKVEA